MDGRWAPWPSRAVTSWEIAILAEGHRTALRCDTARWRTDRIADGLWELLLHGTEALSAIALERDGFHRGPGRPVLCGDGPVGRPDSLGNRLRDPCLAGRSTPR